MTNRQPNATLIEKELLHDDLYILKIQPDTRPIMDFKPGQFTSLGFPKEGSTPDRPRLLRRAYSIASSPLEKEHLEFFIVTVDGGALTPKLAALPLGGRVWMDEKIAGHFVLDPVPDGKDLVLVSTGTGLAPYVSMLRTFRETGRWRKCVIINGVRVAKDLGYRAELEAAAAADPNIHYVPMVTREKGWGGREGRCNLFFEENEYEKLTGEPLDPNRCHVFMCGNPDMIKAVQCLLEERGFREYSQRKSPDGNIHFERYW